MSFSSAKSGIGLRAPHVAQARECRPDVGFFEVHSENYFGGGAKLKALSDIARDYPLSFHGVGLSLGRADGLDFEHIRKLKSLIDRFEPALISEHLSWSAYAHACVPDLLSLPYTHEALQVFIDHVSEFQDASGRRVLIENPSNYLAFEGLEFDEPEFLTRIAETTGCGILLDLNNIYVSARNLGHDPLDYLKGLRRPDLIGQYHLAGHQVSAIDGLPVLIDTHGDHVCDDVWALYAEAIRRFGKRPTLIEWDSDIPDLNVLVAEASRADAVCADTVCAGAMPARASVTADA